MLRWAGKTRIVSLVAVYVLAVFAIMLWPYDFYVPPCRTCANNAVWDPKQGTVEFRSSGMIKSAKSPAGLHDRITAGAGLTIAMWLTTSDLNQTGPARIVSYSRDTRHRNFTIGQEADKLVFRLRTTETNVNATSHQIVLADAFTSKRRQFIVVTYDFSRFHIYVDGKLRKTMKGPGGTFANWDTDHVLLLGNELMGDRPWKGKIDRVLIYDRSISDAEVAEGIAASDSETTSDGPVASYGFKDGRENIITDTSTREPATPLELEATYVDATSPGMFASEARAPTDYLINGAIFVPLGFLLHAACVRGRRRTVQVLIASMLLLPITALTAEALQLYVESRTSALWDFASCVLGGLVGTLAAIGSKVPADPSQGV